MKNLERFSIVVLAILTLAVTACKKFVEVPAPITNTNVENVYTNDASAAAVLNGIYINLAKAEISTSNGLTSIVAATGLSSDEFTPLKDDTEIINYYNNSLNPNSSTVWQKIYSVIYTTNSALEGISESKSVSEAFKMQLIGEAKFIRAFCYFYLVNLYGEVPISITTDYKVNSNLSRSPVELVFKQIESDLIDAQGLLFDRFVNSELNPTIERTRPSKSAATALLARTYLYRKDYVNAEAQASILIENSGLFELVDLDNIFLSNSKEAIWQLQPVGVGSDSNTKEGQFFLGFDGSDALSPSVQISMDLFTSFDDEDSRKVWIKTVSDGTSTLYYPFKYKIGISEEEPREYSMVLRLAEQFLIRAEAKIKQGKIDQGINDLNIIRKRASKKMSQLPLNMSQEDALDAVLNERRHELFGEWGHRWFDIKRVDKANDVLKKLKGDRWQSTDQLYPIPQSDISRNANLIQNVGY